MLITLLPYGLVLKIKCYNAYKMLSMVAINMLLFVSTLRYELPVFFFLSANPHGGLCILPSFPLPKSTYQSTRTKLLPSDLLGWGRVSITDS